MKSLSIALLVLFGIFIGADYCIAYDIADVFQFPLESYSRGGNILGMYNYVGNNQYHLGEDAKAVATVEVYAIGNGKVKHAQNHPKVTKENYGGMYVIEHTLTSGEKVCSLYAHLNFETFTKKEGDDVKKGEYLGQIGTIAQNGGWPEHLHFGILRGGYPENPNAKVCNDWILGGYTSCKDVVDNWYGPTDFLNANIKSNNTTIQYRRVGNLAWYPANKSCVNAQSWIFYKCGYPNGAELVCHSSICQQEENEMVKFLGGRLLSNWYEVIYSFKDLDEFCSKDNNQGGFLQ